MIRCKSWSISNVWLTASAREAALADRVYLLQSGSTSTVPPKDQLFQDWRMLADAGIELPPIYELARSLEACGEKLPAAAEPQMLKEAIVEGWRSRHHDR